MSLRSKFDWKYLCYAFLSAFVPILIAIDKYRFTVRNIGKPVFFYADEFFNASLIQSLIRGHGFKNSIWGAPLGQDWAHAFVSQDSASHFLSAILSFPSKNDYFGMNIYLLLSFSMAGLFFFLTARMLGGGYIESTLLAIFVATLPQHLSWSTQALVINTYGFYFPIFAIFLLSMYGDETTLKKFSQRKYRRFTFAYLFTAGLYYSYFSVGSLLIFGSLVFVVSIFEGSFWPIRRTYKYFLTIIAGFGTASIPSIFALFTTVGDVNYYKGRHWSAALANSGTLIQSILPAQGSLLSSAANHLSIKIGQQIDLLHTIIGTWGVFQEGWNAYVSLFLIFAALLSASAVAVKVSQNSQNSTRNHLARVDRKIYYALVLSGLISFLWLTAGGLGTVFAMFINPALRGYARFSVFLVGALALAVVIGLKQLHGTRLLIHKLLRGAIFALVVVLAVDSTLTSVNVRSGTVDTKVDSISKLTQKFPPDCIVLQFPVVHFPFESPGNPGYEMLAPGLVGTRSDLRWSSGSIGGTQSWVFLSRFRKYESSPSSELIPEARRAGFCAIEVDEKVWNIFKDFKPTPGYPSLPNVSTASFLAPLGKVSRLSSSDDVYDIVYL